MKEMSKKRMVFSFYLNNNTFENQINQIHFFLLEKYINMFDEVIFGVIIDEDIKDETIERFQAKILSFYHKNISFKFYDNTEYREAWVFYNEVATKLEHLDDWTFYAHNKHCSAMPIEELVAWVCGLYYFTLEIPPLKEETGICFYGSPLLTDANFNIKAVKNKYAWYYAGNFYWLKGQEIKRFMDNNKINLPKLTNRYYSEMFPGELSDHLGFATSPFKTYIVGNYGEITYIYQNLYNRENQWAYDRFEEIYNKMMEFIK